MEKREHEVEAGSVNDTTWLRGAAKWYPVKNDRKIMENHGKSREITRNHGKSQEITGNHGKSREITGNHGKSWVITVSLGNLMSTPFEKIQKRLFLKTSRYDDSCPVSQIPVETHSF